MNRGTVQNEIFKGLDPLPGGSTFRSELWIAWGHLRSRQHTNFINVITGLSVIGVLVGVAVLNCVVAVMAGFEVEMIDKILGANAHVVVMQHGTDMIPNGEELSDKLEKIEGVESAAPFVYTEVIAKSDKRHTGVILKGVDPVRTADVTHLVDDLILGPSGVLTTIESRRQLLATLESPPSENEIVLPGIIVGGALLDKLGVQVGDKIQLMNPVGAQGAMGIPIPTVKRFQIAGVFDSGMHEYDQRWTYIPNSVARSFLDMDGRSVGIELTVHDIHDVEAITDRLNAELGYPYVVSHWKDLNGKLFDALKQEKYVASMVSTQIMVIASLLIVSTLIMVVLTRGKEIAILKAMGASGWMILRVFVLQAAFIGAVGVLLGTGVGLIASMLLKAYGWPLETEAFFLTELPVVVQPESVFSIGLGAFLLCVLAALIPAGLAARLDPVPLLRFE